MPLPDLGEGQRAARVANSAVEGIAAAAVEREVESPAGRADLADLNDPAVVPSWTTPANVWVVPLSSKRV